MERTQLLERLQAHYCTVRGAQVDADFLEFEEARADIHDLTLLLRALNAQVKTVYPNPNNSILLYLTGLTDTFDFNEARSRMRGGSPPDCN